MNNQKERHFLSKILDIEEGRYKLAQEAMQIINDLNNDNIEGSPILENIGKPAIYAISHVLSDSNVSDTDKAENEKDEKNENMDSDDHQEPLF